MSDPYVVSDEAIDAALYQPGAPWWEEPGGWHVDSVQPMHDALNAAVRHEIEAGRLYSANDLERGGCPNCACAMEAASYWNYLASEGLAIDLTDNRQKMAWIPRSRLQQVGWRDSLGDLHIVEANIGNVAVYVEKQDDAGYTLEFGDFTKYEERYVEKQDNDE